jgi:hypothetical protein
VEENVDDVESEQEEAEFPACRPASRYWFPKTKQRKKHKIKDLSVEVTNRQVQCC